MENFTSLQVALAFLTAIIVGLIIPVTTAITGKLKERKLQKQSDTNQKIAAAADVKRLGLAEDERNSQETWKLLEYWKQKAETCERRVAELEIGRSVPSAIITQLYRAIAALGREIATSELMVLRGAPIEAVMAQNERVRTAYDTLSGILP